MGKGDIKSKKGKIANGSYGVRRKRTAGTAKFPAKPKTAVVAVEVTAEVAETKAVAKEKPAKKEKNA